MMKKGCLTILLVLEDVEVVIDVLQAKDSLTSDQTCEWSSTTRVRPVSLDGKDTSSTEIGSMGKLFFLTNDMSTSGTGGASDSSLATSSLKSLKSWNESNAVKY